MKVEILASLTYLNGLSSSYPYFPSFVDLLKPCIFTDEIDNLLSNRTNANESNAGHGLVSHFLTLMQGALSEDEKTVTVIGL